MRTFGDTTGKTEWAIRNPLSRVPGSFPVRRRMPTWRAMLVLLLRDVKGIVPAVPPLKARGPVSIYETTPRGETLGNERVMPRFHEIGPMGITREEDLPLWLRGWR